MKSIYMLKKVVWALDVRSHGSRLFCGWAGKVNTCSAAGMSVASGEPVKRKGLWRWGQ